VSQGVPVRRAPAPESREALTFRTDAGTMRRVRDYARLASISVNEALNRVVKVRFLEEQTREVVRRSYRLTPEQVKVVDALVASLGVHTTGEDGA
jgi:chromosome condensin MukBEF complex kleisin-like MukF subunit